MVRLHAPVEVVGPGVLQGEEVEGHGLPAVDDLLGREGFLRLLLIEDKGAAADLVSAFHGGSFCQGCKGWEFGVGGRGGVAAG